MYVPDRNFMKKAKRLDPKLGCFYNADINRFVVTYDRAIGDPASIMVAGDNNGKFRQPDERDISRLHEGDTHRTPLKDRLQRTAKYFEDDKRKQQKRVHEDFRDRAKDDKNQLYKAFSNMANTGKCRKIVKF